jgi:hypothetical protein
MASSFTSFFLPPFSSWRLPNFADFTPPFPPPRESFDVPTGGEDWESDVTEAFSPLTSFIFFVFFFASVLRRTRSPFSSSKEQRTAQSKDSTMKMKTLRFARECVYIYLLKRRPDANKCILHSENTNAQKERESVGEITPFLCESSSLNVRHTFDTFSRENVRERQKSEQTKLLSEKQSTQTHENE